MRTLTVLFAAALAIFGEGRALAQTTGAGAQTPGLDALAWMSGAWSGTAGTASIEEHWTAPAGRTMLAVGRVTRGDRTLAFEFLRLEERADGIFYVAQPGGRPATEFRLTKLEGQSAVFENPQHDNPKVIRYSREGDAMVAETEGDEKGKHVTQRFSFRKK